MSAPSSSSSSSVPETDLFFLQNLTLTFPRRTTITQLQLTSCRILMGTAEGDLIEVPHTDVISIQIQSDGGYFSATKLLSIQAKNRGELRITTAFTTLEQLYNKYSQAIQQLHAAMEKKASELVKGAGVGGLIRAATSRQEKTEANLTEAFSDLNALMQKAKEMVELARKFEGALNKQQQQSSPASAEDAEAAKFRSYMVSLGIATPITKKAAGDQYHAELARQISEFLQKPLKDSGGMMPLPEVYCLYNRARGTDLISPQDLLHAAELMSTLSLTTHLRRFESGLLVIQSSDKSDEALAQRTHSLVKSRTRLTALELSQLTSISLPLAMEQLLFAEKCGLLCRDDTIEEGLSFYDNIFLADGVSIPSASASVTHQSDMTASINQCT